MKSECTMNSSAQQLGVLVLSFNVLFILLSFFHVTEAIDGDTYDIGVGIADITGPAAQVNLMGYANLEQNSKGIHLRQFSRAYIFGDGQQRIVFVSIDAGMSSQAIKTEVARVLKTKYGGMYTIENMCISGTHTHSGPGGFFQYFLYDITSLGFVKETFNNLVNGIVKINLPAQNNPEDPRNFYDGICGSGNNQSIDSAHNNVKQGRIFYDQGDLTDASANRSPLSYLQNPPEERARYEFDTDKNMFLLKLVDMENNPIGMINWFAVHGTSMNNTNDLISSDNKGYASVLFENEHNPAGTFPGQGPFVGAFAQSNEGDSSPNTDGAKCLDTGLSCDELTSTCNGKNSLCVAFGPGGNMFESTRIIAEKQYAKANELFGTATKPIHGPVQFIHQHIQMSNRQMMINGKTETTCKAALGFSFAAGTTDGPGVDGFHQGTTTSTENKLLGPLSQAFNSATGILLDCHNPKAVFVPTGELLLPYDWTPDITPTQVLRLGNLIILAVPGEFTTMSGRRLREAVQALLSTTEVNQDGDLQVVIAGLSNIYTNYIATFEEYQIQRYEGASTLFGPYTLDAYIEQFKYLASNMLEQTAIDPGPDPPNLLDRQVSLVPEVLLETTPIGRKFGDVLVNVNTEYSPGSVASASFVCGNPRNNNNLESFLTVEYRDPGSGAWKVVATDAFWETKFYWEQSNALLSQSTCTVEWDIPSNAVTGDYRIRHSGFHKSLLLGMIQYVGTSRVFKVNAGNGLAKRMRGQFSIRSHRFA